MANQFCSFGLFNTALNSVQVRTPERFGSWVGVVLLRYPKRVLMMLRMIERFGRLEVEKHYPKYYKKDIWIPSPYRVKVLMSQKQLASVKCLVCKALEKTNSTEFYRICWDWRGRTPKSSAIVISWSQGSRAISWFVQALEKSFQLFRVGLWMGWKVLGFFAKQVGRWDMRRMRSSKRWHPKFAGDRFVLRMVKIGWVWP